MGWFRFYDGVLDDPKVQKLSLSLRWRWVNLLCLANRGTPRGVLPTMQAVAFGLRATEATATRIVADLKAVGLLDDTPDGLMPHNWRGRQYESDFSVTRTRRYRERHGTVTVTVPEQKQNRNRTETEQNRNTKTLLASTPKVVFANAVFEVPSSLLEEWQKAYPAVDVPGEIRRAHAWAVANPKNRKSNWAKFLVNWLKRTQDRAPRVEAAVGGERLPDWVREMREAES